MTYTALYRRFRPRLFADLVGQEHISRTLAAAIRQGSFVHAYLFCGPRGTGKTSTARIMARAVNCLSPTQAGEPCDECEACRRNAQGEALDILEIDAASNRGIDEIRDLRERVKYAPALEKYKVYIIDEVHMLTAPAFNALLKTLEEPPPQVLFILATTEPHKMPLTVLSRCQRFDFRRIGDHDLAAHLAQVSAAEGYTAAPEALALIARKVEGGMRDALGLLDQCAGFNDGHITVEALNKLTGNADAAFIAEMTRLMLAADAAGLMGMVARLHAEGHDLRQFLRDLLEYQRELLLAKLSPARESLPAWAQAAGANQLLKLMQSLSDGDGRLRVSLQPRLTLELALLSACGGALADSGGQRREDRGGKTGAGGQGAEGRGQKTEVGGQRTEDRGQKAGPVSRGTENSVQNIDNRGRKSAEGSQAILPDKQIAVSDGQVAISDSKVTAFDSQVTALDSPDIVSDSIAAVSDSQLTASSGQETASDNQVAASDGQVTVPDSQATASDSQVTALGGQATASDDQVAASDGQVTASGDQVATSDGQVTASGDQVAASDVQVNAPDSHVTALGGQATASDNQVAALDVQVTALDGQVTTPDSQVTALGGQATASDNQVAASDVQATAPDGQMTRQAESKRRKPTSGAKQKPEEHPQQVTPAKNTPGAKDPTTSRGSVAQGAAAGDTRDEGTADAERDLEQVKELWPQILQAVGRANASTGAFLDKAKPLALRQDRLTLVFEAKYALFMDNLCKPGATRDLLEQKIAALCGRKLTIEGLLAQADPAKPATQPQEEQGSLF